MRVSVYNLQHISSVPSPPFSAMGSELTSGSEWGSGWLVCNPIFFSGCRVRGKEEKEAGKETRMILTETVIPEVD